MASRGAAEGDAAEPLLEREHELSALDALLADAERGSGRLAVLEGPAGIGKTRLVSDLRQRAEARGHRVLSARGSELERDFAFGIVRQLLEPVLRGADEAERERLMSGAAAFAEPVFAEHALDASPAGDPSYGVLHGLYWLVANMTERGPALIVLDDAHWADRPSLRFLAFLSRRLEALPLGAVVASRPDEPGAESRILHGLCREVGVHPIVLEPLSPDAVAQVVRARLGAGDDALGAACHEVTGGNPFLVRELLVELARRADDVAVSPKTVRELGPAGVAAAASQRLTRLPPEASALARAVAVLGDGADVAHAAELEDLSPQAATIAADALIDAALLEAGPPLRFVHPIVRAAIHADLGLAERSQAHARAARLLARYGGEADAVALHLLATEPAGDDWVVETLRRAAGAARGRGAPEVAARYLRRALSEPPEDPAVVLVELGTAEALAGEPDASEHLRAALELASEPSLQVWATIELGQVLAYAGAVGEATDVALETLELVSERRDLARPLEMLLLVFSQTELGARGKTGELIRRASRAVERAGADAPRGLLAIIALERALVDGTADEAAALAQAALGDGHLLEEQTAEAPHAYFAAGALTLADRGELAERHLGTAMAEARRRGSARGFGLASAMRAWCRYRQGVLAGAEGDARAFLELAAEPGWELFRPAALSALVDVLVERGELAEGTAALERWDVDRRAPDSILAQPLRESRARLRMAEGRAPEALAELAACARWEEGWGAANGAWVPWRSAAAVAHAALGDHETARRLAADEIECARRFGAARSLGIALSAAGVVESAGRGVELLRDAAAALEGSGARLEHARALVRLGTAIRREGRPSESREPLRSGLDLASRCGASALAETARQELLAAGGRPRRPRLRGREALTPSERRVTELAAEGLSNREIAQALFLTVRTIEMHLTGAYRRLGIRSRSELADALSGEERPVTSEQAAP